MVTNLLTEINLNTPGGQHYPFCRVLFDTVAGEVVSLTVLRGEWDDGESWGEATPDQIAAMQRLIDSGACAEDIRDQVRELVQ